MDVEAEIAREEGAGVGNKSNRDERSRKRGERSCEQGEGAGTGQRKNRSRDERAELVWSALEKELRKGRKRGRDDTVSLTLVRRRAKAQKKVHDAEALLEQISEWMDASDFGRTVGDELSVVTDVTAARDLWRKRKHGDGGLDETGSASRDDGTSKR